MSTRRPPTTATDGTRAGASPWCCSRFNDLIVFPLSAAREDALVRHGVADESIAMVWVPGAWRSRWSPRRWPTPGRYDAIVGLGAVIRGATYHFEIVADQSAAGLARVALDTGVVVTNGILTVDTMDQALERAGSKAGNKGADAALAALDTLGLVRQIAACA